MTHIKFYLILTHKFINRYDVFLLNHQVIIVVVIKYFSSTVSLCICLQPTLFTPQPHILSASASLNAIPSGSVPASSWPAQPRLREGTLRIQKKGLMVIHQSKPQTHIINCWNKWTWITKFQLQNWAQKCCTCELKFMGNLVTTCVIHQQYPLQIEQNKHLVYCE